MTLFYIGLNPRWQKYTWLPARINVMYSAAGYWSGNGWRKKNRYMKGMGLRWLDGGGFTMLNKFGSYPYTPVEFMNLVAWLNPDYFASLDYPCEPEITRSLVLQSNTERIQATVKNAIIAAEWENHVSGQLVPVIQGYTLEEYLSCIELHQAAGTIREYMAVGSMCRRINNAELHRLIPGIWEAATKAGVRRLHFFGLKLSRSLIDLSEMIYSRDSAVGLDDYDDELRKQRGGRRWPIGQQEKQASYQAFFNRLDGLGLSYTDNMAAWSNKVCVKCC